jgi:hypothetical protein
LPNKSNKFKIGDTVKFSDDFASGSEECLQMIGVVVNIHSLDAIEEVLLEKEKKEPYFGLISNESNIEVYWFDKEYTDLHEPDDLKIVSKAKHV